MAHSWGSDIGILAAQKRPDLYKAFIGVGQVVNIIEGQQISYDFVLNSATKANDSKSLAKLNNIGKPPYTEIKKLKSLVSLIEKYNGAVYNGTLNGIVKKGASTKEYNLWDWVWRFNKGINFSLKHLLPHTLALDIKQQIPFLNMPTFFISGDHDMQTPTSLINTFYKDFTAPKKEIFIIPNCGHMVPFEKPNEFSTIVIDIANTIEK